MAYDFLSADFTALFHLTLSRRLAHPGQAASVQTSKFKRHTPAQHRHARNYKRKNPNPTLGDPFMVIHSQGGISMLISAPGLTVRSRPNDHAITNHGIELNHADDYRTDRRELCFHTRGTEIRSRHTRTSTAANSAARPLPTSSASSAETARLMIPHYGKPPCIPSYRDNHAPRLSVFGTPRRNTLRGPPGSSRRPRGAQRDASKQRDVDQKLPPACECRVNARLRRRLTRKQTGKN